MGHVVRGGAAADRREDVLDVSDADADGVSREVSLA